MPFVGQLYDFQRRAVDNMIGQGDYAVCMDKGMGKTVLTIAACEELLDDGEVESVLIIADKTLQWQWAHMINQFTGNKASVAVIDGVSPAKRAQQYLPVIAAQFDYCIITYAQVVNDWRQVLRVPRDIIVCDEITRIKGFKAQRSKKVKRLHGRYHWGLTGSMMIENSADELFSQMEWVNPDVLGNWWKFEEQHVLRNDQGWITDLVNLKSLRRKLEPWVYAKSRHDEDVRDEYPSVVEESLLIDFDSAGRKLYGQIARELHDLLEQSMSMFGGSFNIFAHYQGEDEHMVNEMVGQIMTRLMCLGMLCCHPEVIRASAEKYNTPKEQAGSGYAALLEETGRLDRLGKRKKLFGVDMIWSPKLEAVVEEIQTILDANKESKVVLFSHYRAMLPIIAEATQHLTKSVQFVSKLNAQERDDVKQRFSNDPRIRLFLSNDCGGYGLDLPMANYLISYDLPWSGGQWGQRNGRIIRLSSEFPEVTLESALMAGSVEERQYAKVTQKVKLAEAVMSGKKQRSDRFELEAHSLYRWLSEEDV